MSKRYVPDTGDIVWLDFEPQSGKEITKRRPALIMTSKAYNKSSQLCYACPITSQIKGFATEVNVMVSKKESVILTHQMKSLDWQSRKAKLISRAPKQVLQEAQEKIVTILLGDDR